MGKLITFIDSFIDPDSQTVGKSKARYITGRGEKVARVILSEAKDLKYLPDSVDEILRLSLYGRTSSE